MRYFIDNIKTYASVNKKGRALQIYVQQFDRHLIADECSLDALKCDIEQFADVVVVDLRHKNVSFHFRQNVSFTHLRIWFVNLLRNYAKSKHF